ncbi:hypothetical protein [Rhizobacter sp. P5_C2]
MSAIQVSRRGGAQVGWLNASWPLASIQITPDALTVSVLEKYTFVPAQVHAIEAIGSIPVLNTGIRIHHTRADYPEKVIFYSVGGRDSLLQAAGAAGFPVGELAVQTKRGFPVKVSAIVVFVLLWNALFLLDRGGSLFDTSSKLGPYSFLALALAFAVASLTPRSSRLQQLILRDGHDVGEIRGFLRLLQLVTGGLALAAGHALWVR